MKRIPFVLFFIFIYNLTFSQSITPKTQNIGGTLGIQNGYSLTFSVGEMVSTTNFVGSNNLSISSGFLQSNTPLVTGLFDLNRFSSNTIWISPNPASHNIRIQAKGVFNGIYYLQIIDAASNIKFRETLIVYSNEFNKSVSLDHLVQGVYYISINLIQSNHKSQFGIYKFIKL